MIPRVAGLDFDRIAGLDFDRIATVTVSGTDMTITLTDGTVLGPFSVRDLPEAKATAFLGKTSGCRVSLEPSSLRPRTMAR
jgi:hypothetical protein